MKARVNLQDLKQAILGCCDEIARDFSIEQLADRMALDIDMPSDYFQRALTEGLRLEVAQRLRRALRELNDREEHGSVRFIPLAKVFFTKGGREIRRQIARGELQMTDHQARSWVATGGHGGQLGGFHIATDLNTDPYLGAWQFWQSGLSAGFVRNTANRIDHDILDGARAVELRRRYRKLLDKAPRVSALDALSGDPELPS